MKFSDALRVLRQRWYVAVVVAAAAFVITVSVFFIAPIRYTAPIQLYVSAQSTGDNTQGAYQGVLLSEQRVTSYVQLVNSPRLADAVISDLRLDETPTQVSSQITASSTTDAVIIDVTASSSSADEAAAIANSIGRNLPPIVDELERPRVPNAPAVVALRVVQFAQPPLQPSSPGLISYAALGALAALVCGVGSAFLWNSVDTRIKSGSDLSRATSLPLLGEISFDRSVGDDDAFQSIQGSSQRTEELRQLRTSLQFIDLDNERKVIAISSALPGEGKTTIACSVAESLAHLGQRVLLIDGDLRRPRVAEALSLEPSVGLTTVLTGRLPLQQATQRYAQAGLDVLTSGVIPPNPSELLGSRGMQLLLEEARRSYDTVILDTPPVLPVTDAVAVAPSTDGVVVICRANKVRTAELESVFKALSGSSARALGLVLNMKQESKRASYRQYGEYVSSRGTSADPRENGRASTVTVPRPYSSSGRGE